LMLVLLYLDIRHASNTSKCDLHHIKLLAIDDVRCAANRQRPGLRNLA
jgi:hypothetical protein